jgi:glycosyltransferase involved in cell wall biosynthesis
MIRSVSILVPVFNEAESLTRLLAELLESSVEIPSPEVEIVFVDDGSSDGSGELLSDLCSSDPRLRVLSHQRNRGQSAALATAFEAARGEVFVTLDADLQNPPSEITKLLAALEDESVDVVLAVRSERRDSWSIRMASRVGNAVRRGVLGDDVRDAGCGMMAFRRRALRGMPRFDGMHRFLASLWRARGEAVAVIPVEHRPREFGESKYSISGRAVRGVLDLFGVWWLIRRSIHDREDAKTDR